jgi:hypothetical protein
VSWWSYLAGPWRSAAATSEILARLKQLESHMADVSPILNQLADDMAAWAAGPFAELLAENARLAARNAELEGEDAAETTAADRAVTEFNRIVAPVSEAPEVPTEIPPVEVPNDQS